MAGLQSGLAQTRGNTRRERANSEKRKRGSQGLPFPAEHGASMQDDVAGPRLMPRRVSVSRRTRRRLPA